MKHRCFNCRYIYDDRIEEINFMELNEEWVCPECNAYKSEIELIEEGEESVELGNVEEAIKSEKNLKEKYLL